MTPKPLNRRGVLRFLSAAPIAGKQLADEAVSKLVGVNPLFLGTGTPESAMEPPRAALDSSEAKYFKEAWRIPALRKEIESIVYEHNKRVYYLDTDLAIKRSFSYSAKITFQRQRNVAREIRDDWFEDSPWRQKQSLLKRLMAKFVGL